MEKLENYYLHALGDLPVSMTDDEFMSWVKDESGENDYLYEKIDGGKREALVDALLAFEQKAENTSCEDIKDLLLTRCLIIMEEIHKIDISNG